MGPLVGSPGMARAIIDARQGSALGGIADGFVTAVPALVEHSFLRSRSGLPQLFSQLAVFTLQFFSALVEKRHIFYLLSALSRKIRRMVFSE